jgi:hypothetical protein
MKKAAIFIAGFLSTSAVSSSANVSQDLATTDQKQYSQELLTILRSDSTKKQEVD